MNRVIDYRTKEEELFYIYPYSDEFVPKDIKNEIFPMETFDKTEKRVVQIGELQSGSDGFLEALFFIDGKLVKLKRYPDDKKIYVSIFS
jgi:hypothetical protein